MAALLPLLLLFAGAAPAGKTLEITGPDVALSGVAFSVLQRAYEKLGITLVLRAVPLRRALQASNAGEVDGELMRIAAALREHGSLLMISVPVAHISVFAYGRGANCPVKLSLAELAGKRLAYVRGTRAIESQVPAQALLATPSHRDALRHLQRGIADYVLADELETDALLLKHPSSDICKAPQPVITADLFHALNKRHAELVPRVEKVLKEMADQGEIARIWAAEAQRAREAIVNTP